MLSDQDLVLELQRGSLDALGQIYDRYQQVVYRTALVISGDEDAANDLLQDVFLRLFRFADHIDPQRPLQPWIYRMTANLSYTWVKRNKRWYQPLEDLVDWFTGGDVNTTSDTAERNDDCKKVQEAVSSLPLQQRMVVVLYYMNELSLQEISEIVQVPIGTVKSRLHYGRQALKQILGEQHGFLPDLSFEGVEI